MKTSEVVIGQDYLFVNNGQFEHKRQFNNQVVKVLKRIKGNSNKNAFHVNKRAKKPDKFLLDVGIYANAANLKPIQQ